jgi:hypothetical protein
MTAARQHAAAALHQGRMRAGARLRQECLLLRHERKRSAIVGIGIFLPSVTARYIAVTVATAGVR